ncbi:hypothetical protein JOQ06_023174 [Pogonophryne albipinna]|uniref:Uncharacterized protein n=1 Tax=Pogonophryne albipinna TaxID=1090488 RepID=A0AAD6BIL0_9TELE|nr:hypothetical protein JOQ06_023174 [Pogonophryne albipinna]
MGLDRDGALAGLPGSEEFRIDQSSLWQASDVKRNPSTNFLGTNVVNAVGALLTRYPAGHLLSAWRGVGQRMQLDVSLIYSIRAVWFVLSSDWLCRSVFYELQDGRGILVSCRDITALCAHK